MADWERTLIYVMLAAAAVGTILFVFVEYQRRGSSAAVGWSIVAVVWFVVLRRLIHRRR